MENLTEHDPRSSGFTTMVQVIDYFTCFRSALENRIQLQRKFFQLQEENSKVRKEVQVLMQRCRKMRCKKRQRRATRRLDKNHACPYEQCGHAYASNLALNLHIKKKHLEGTKTERLGLAKSIDQAQKGLTPSQISINLPPNPQDELNYFAGKPKGGVSQSQQTM